MNRWLWLGVLAGCGRIEFDTVAARTCPAGMVEIAPDATVCIDVAERGTATWVIANDTCLGADGRLCSDAEWLTACQNVPTLAEMFNDGAGASQNWEWVAEESAGVAQKRGLGACTDTSAHETMIDPYDYRCCADK